MKTVGIPPIAPIIFLVGITAAVLCSTYSSAPTQDERLDPVRRRTAAFFERIDPDKPLTETSPQARLLSELYHFPIARLAIIDHQPVDTGASCPGRIVTAAIVLAEDIGTCEVVRRKTRLYWRQTDTGILLDFDASMIDAKTVNMLRTVRDAGPETAGRFLKPSERSPANAKRLVQHYNWLADKAPLTRHFKLLLIEMRANGSRAVSSVLWAHTETQTACPMQIQWRKMDGKWFVEMP